MKEATGELNMTVVTVVAIAALVGIFYVFIWPTIQVGMALSSACSSAGSSATFDSYFGSGDQGHIHCESGTCTVQDVPNGLNIGKNSSKSCDQAVTSNNNGTNE